MIRIALAVAAMLAPVPALAENPVPAVDLIAAITVGVVHGGQVVLGSVGDVTQTAAGVFEVRDAAGRSIGVTVEEGGSCVFILTLSTAGAVPQTMLFDTNRVSGYVFTAGERVDVLNAIEVLLEGEEGMVLAMTEDGMVAPPESRAVLVTSLGRDELEAAVVTLRETYCPGLAG